MLNKCIIAILAINLISCSDFDKVDSSVVMVSVSSDAHYALTTHYGRFLVLWDIQNKTKQILNQKTNIYSPYFIQNSDRFLWQDAETNEVYEQSVDGKITQHIHLDFPVFGHVAQKNFNHYVASNKNWSLFTYKNKKISRFKKGVAHGLGRTKLFKLSLENDLLLGVGMGSFNGEEYPFCIGNNTRDIYPTIPKRVNHSLLRGMVLWDLVLRKPVKKFIGLSGKSVADLSPDTKYVVGADEQSILYVWETKTGKRLFHSNNPVQIDFNCCGQKKCLDSLDELIQTKMVIPADFYSHPDAISARNVAVKFIDEEGDFIRFIDSVNYGTLYNVNSPKIRAYMPLGDYPKPDIYHLFFNANIIDTAPKATILVMGQQPDDDPRSNGGTGIIVYHFDKKTKQLERIWAPEGPPPHYAIRNNDNHWER